MNDDPDSGLICVNEAEKAGRDLLWGYKINVIKNGFCKFDAKKNYHQKLFTFELFLANANKNFP